MKVAIAAAALLGAAAWPCAAQAQDYPNRPIRMVVPWPPGGVTDVIARGLAQHMSDSMGQPIVADNRPGAAGTVGVGIVAKAPPDGYTIMMSDVPSHAISATLYSRLAYDPVKDIEPIALPSRSPRSDGMPSARFCSSTAGIRCRNPRGSPTTTSPPPCSVRSPRA